MKKLFMIMAVIFSLTTIASAQGFNYRVKGGLTTSSLVGKDVEDIGAKAGFHIGVGAEYEFRTNIFLQSGLVLTTKGGKESDASMDFLYLQVPVNAAFKISVTNNLGIVLHVGPYFAYGLSGKFKFAGESIDLFAKGKLEEAGVHPAKRFDAGLGFGAGVEFGKLFVDLNIDAGMMKFMENLDATNMCAFLSLGMKF